jgi:hypothetical protein
MRSAKLRRGVTAVAMTAASLGTMAFGAGAAHASGDTYLCKTTININNQISVTGCIHLGGNGYWQPYVIIHGGSGQDISGNMWINSNGVYSSTPAQGLSGYQQNNVDTNADMNQSFVIWGASTNWRVNCYVQAQESFYIDTGYVGTVYSPSVEVC